ncbi:uncharacterized protein [Venturia canescens]|uniref:uncharacterized protein n=1 Tax=Venturia canescens TaxID=32260 RepID=UPI001C9C8B3F|nr:uncharacterized protein LOC122416927 [Venturia canescens]
MSLKYVLLVAFVVTANLRAIQAHGRVMDPVHRGSAWRVGFDTPKNWNDMGNYCGGISTQNGRNGGKCGLCGDNYADPVPRENENGGTYGTGTITKTYKAGQVIDVDVDLTAAHLGYFEFFLCPLNSTTDRETEECFDQYKLKLADGEYRYNKIYGPKHYYLKVVLPKNVTCEHCVFRWQYRAGNMWGVCEDGRRGLGCGPQELYRTCSDIKIV